MMKVLLMLWAVCLLMMYHKACAMASSPRADTASAVHGAWEKDTLVYRAAKWELRIDYLQRGTRSEGQHGRLLLKGKEIGPETDGEVRPTPFGDLKHYGTERKTLWAVSGWNFADRARIRPSEMIEPNERKSTRQHKEGRSSVEVSMKVPREGGRFNVNAKTSERLIVRFAGQPGTGYQWQLKQDNNPKLLRLKGRQDIPSEKPGVLGAESLTDWIFEALRSGTETLHFEYCRPWEKDKPPAHTATITIKVLP